MAFDVRTDARKFDNFRARGFNKLMKIGLGKMLLEWHKKYIQGHFDREAYRKYDYPLATKKQGRPLVRQGDFRRDIVKRASESQVKGTSTTRRLRLPFGRPGRPTAKDLLKMVFIEMQKSNLTFKQAQARIGREQNYSRDVRRKMQESLATMTDSEQAVLRGWLFKCLYCEFAKRGPKKRRKVR